ncbi:hypothetical protein ASPZODRAFT_75160 [Penicilliopsis zonata CBS 506.65]|uniref:Cyclin N-terminal domain-containing protein n=1 Tax=Penicilliopsis zonata CBS 506.65 TaxID=1073090 RepID=A0A1L9S7K7_9EURO|nr:hypothetical protein ASPZODRAFT_75160 [Penicilliopsis zonata CBS 506.65]OJJ43145.1 hypothetical protein ASPZODRAFT_75160 [Penicilliopsis zonata CBS 506.65]
MSGMDVLGLMSNPSIHNKVSHAHPYASAISSSASSSSSSVFSLDGLSSQGSISSVSTNPVDVIWENEGEMAAAQCPRGAVPANVAKLAEPTVAPELRKHPRRTNSFVVQANGTLSARPPPCLLRQSDRKVSFVDNLVDTASQIVEIIWPLSAVAMRSDSATGCKGILPLRTFIQETLRRSRTSYSTLQVALYYLIKIKPHVPNQDFTREQRREKPLGRAMQCGRRMFLAALILASKYLQDRNYSARAWSKISGLNTLEINQNELMFLEAIDWRLHMPDALFQRWTEIVLRFTPGAGGAPLAEGHCWRTILPRLTPELDTLDLFLPSMSPVAGPSSSFDVGLMADTPSPRSSSSSDAAPSPVSCEQTMPAGGPRAFPPMPSLVRPGMLPTPQLTPRSVLTTTPAVSLGGFPPRGTSIGAAMSQAQSLSLSRSTLDQRPPPSLTSCPKAGPSSSFEGYYPTMVRRSSLARSTSSASSPESMVSDVSTLSSRSSRSSRSSSISSTASGNCAPVPPRLAVQATRRCANASIKEARKPLAIASPIDETSLGEVYHSPGDYTGPVGPVPDLSHFSLGTPVDLTPSAHEAAKSLCELSAAASTTDVRRCRKRGRTGSDDLLLQHHVRHLIQLHANRDSAVLPDGSLPASFLMSEPHQPQAAVSAHSLNPIRLPPVPLSGPIGMKRACCGSEARQIALHSGLRPGFMN